MSKWITLLLSIVVMALTIVPCCPMDDCADEVTSCSTENPFEQKGACSPFAACGSCSGFAPITRAIQLSLPVTCQTIHHEKHTDLLPSTYKTALFQPPRANPSI